MLKSSFAEWVAILLSLCAIVGGGLAYYVNTEIERMETRLIEHYNTKDDKVNLLLNNMDKRITILENNQLLMKDLQLEIKGLRRDLTDLKITIAKKGD